FSTARQRERREQSPARVVHRVTGDTLLLHLRDEPFDIVAHQIEPVNVVTVRGMYGDFRRWQAKDQPAVAHVNMRPSEEVPQEGSVGLRTRAIDNRMCANDHESSSFLFQHVVVKPPAGLWQTRLAHACDGSES